MPYPDPAESIIQDVALATGLKEGPEGVANLLRLVGSSGALTLKELSRAARLPVPVLAAVRGELEARGVLERQAGLKLAPLGVEVLSALGGGWSPAVCPTCGGAGTVVPERYHGVLHTLTDMWQRRPQVDVRLDQSFALPESNLRRCLFALDRGALLGRRVLFLGDDDAGSIATALLARELGSNVEVSALDVDPRVLSYIQGAAGAEKLPITLVEHDARQPLPGDLLNSYDTVFTDPPYTLPGLRLFLSRALQAVRQEVGASVFLSFGHRPPVEMVELLALLAEMRVGVSELRPGFNRYEGASVLAGTSDLYHLLPTSESTASLRAESTDPIYTGELRPRVREYVCRACGASYKIGAGRQWETIESLKDAGCPRCGAHSFEQRRARRG